MQTRIVILASALSLVGVEASHAVTLYSSTLKATSSGRRLQCSVVNVSNEPRTAIFSIVSWNGTVLNGPSGLSTIPPGEMRLWTHTTSSWAYCKVQVSGLKTDWRGAFELQAWLNSTPETRVSVPLQ